MDFAYSTVTCGDLHLLLWLHTDKDPTADEWSAALEDVSAVKARVGDLDRLRGMAISDGGAPNSIQRQELFVGLLESRMKSTAVSDVLQNPIKRGILTAINWLNPNFRAFPTAQLDRALAHLDLQDHVPTLLAALRDLKGQVKPIASLEAILARAER